MKFCARCLVVEVYLLFLGQSKTNFETVFNRFETLCCCVLFVLLD